MAIRKVSTKGGLSKAKSVSTKPTAQTLVDSAVQVATAAGREFASVKLTLEKVGTIELSRSVQDHASWKILSTPREGLERVREAERLLAEGKVYPRGCSEFVCAVLGIPFELANKLMGDTPVSQGKRPPYKDLAAGDVAGWVNLTGPGHVAIFIDSNINRMFIHVKEPGEKPSAKNGFFDCELFKSSRF